ncbi:MAG: hypothetical protein QMD46_12405 [Methanomicrobiales archaeon]|nr:hypothetical protein [Methanomicrobiales archaeon]
MTENGVLWESMLAEEAGLYVCRHPKCYNFHRCRFFYPSQAFIRFARTSDCPVSPMEVQGNLQKEGS